MQINEQHKGMSRKKGTAMKNIMMKFVAIITICGCLASCQVNTTTNDGPGIAFPTPGEAGNEQGPIMTEKTDNDQSEQDEKPEDVEADAPETDTPEEQNGEQNPEEPKNEEQIPEEPKNEEQIPEDPKSQEQPPEEIGSEEQNNEDKESEDTNGESEVLPESEEWMLLLVNPWNYLPEDYNVELVNLKGGQQADKRVYPYLQEMMDDMRAEGLSPYVCSSYRTINKQTTLYNNQIKQYLNKGYNEEDAKVEAGRWVAVPGTSEHHTGMAFDIVAADYVVLDETQEKEPEQQWLMENSWKYGFILRYPNGKTDITGIYYEPWHYRFVGLKAAKEIYESGVTLEEYIAARNN